MHYHYLIVHTPRFLVKTPRFSLFEAFNRTYICSCRERDFLERETNKQTHTCINPKTTQYPNTSLSLSLSLLIQQSLFLSL